MQHILLLPPQLLRTLLRIRNPGRRIPIQQLLPIRHIRRPNRIMHRRPARAQRDEPQQRRPARVREHVQQGLFHGAAVDYDAAGSGDRDGGDAEEDVENVHEDARAENDDAQAPEETGAADGVALVEFGLLGARGGEGGGFAAEEAREEEGADDGYCVVCCCDC
jgi:hypothetical protein